MDFTTPFPKFAVEAWRPYRLSCYYKGGRDGKIELRFCREDGAPTGIASVRIISSRRWREVGLVVFAPISASHAQVRIWAKKMMVDRLSVTPE